MILENPRETQLQILYSKGKNRIDFFKLIWDGTFIYKLIQKKITSL